MSVIEKFYSGNCTFMISGAMETFMVTSGAKMSTRFDPRPKRYVYDLVGKAVK